MSAYTTTTPVIEHARQYADLGFKLVAWHGGSPVCKFPKRQSWGLEPLDPNTLNGEDMIGLNHGLSHTVVIDGDNLELTRVVFDALGLSVDAMPGDPPSYRGNPARLKWLYRLPKGFTPPGVKKLSGKVCGVETTVFELRGCPAGKQAQDVLPPSRHPMGAYEWINPPVAYDQLPELPEELAGLWLNWDAFKDLLGTIAGFDLPRKKESGPDRKPQSKSPQASVIETFNAANRIEDIIERHGYERRGSKWLALGSTTGAPGINITTINGKQRLYSHHGSDPLGASEHSGHSLDAFDVSRILNHGGNAKVAVKAASGALGMSRNIDPAPETTAPDWPELADPFAEYPIPHFPMDVLPEAFRTLTKERSAQSGFDPGGYAFCLLVAASHIIDHRCALNLGPFCVPAYLWGAVVGASGAGKSPIIREGKRAAEAINSELMEHSRSANSLWELTCETAKADKAPMPKRPPWRQRHALDTTVEALGKLLVENPEGINLYFDEMTEFLGRMDAYSGKDGGKDRATYIRAYDGGQVTINRASRSPLVVPQFSVGILAGVQPELLAQKFKAVGAGADGLYQRFLMYCPHDSGEVDYSAMVGDYTEANVSTLFQGLNELAGGKAFTVNASSDAKRALQAFHNNMRTLAKRTPAHRFAEHLDKYPGFLGRLAITLHLIDAVENGTDPLRMLTGETMAKAISLMGVLYRHSEAVYHVLDREAGGVRKLVQGAAEAILTKGWAEFMRGDLTRDATYWQGCDSREAEGAIDHLIELGWIADITAAVAPGKKGRRSAGRFLVGPDVHKTFSGHAERVKSARADRFRALRSLKTAI